MDSKILEVTVTRDQIERFRNLAEYLFQLGGAVANDDDMDRTYIAEILFHYSANLASDVHEIREANGITVRGEEVDPPEGFNATMLQDDPAHKNEVHRILRVDGQVILAIQAFASPSDDGDSQWRNSVVTFGY